MDYKKTKKTIFPLKVSDAFYTDLKYVAKSEGLPVSAFVRKHLEPVVTQKAKKLNARGSKKKTFSEFVMSNQFKGKTYFEDKSVDEILYGEKLHEDEK